MNSFLEACGAPCPWQLRVESSGAPLPHFAPFDQPFLVIGQDAAADLRLDHKDVGERHAFLLWVRGRLQVIDLGSRTGILWEGRRQRVGWLDPGQSIRIGPYRLVLPEAETAADSAGDPPIPTLALDMKLRGIRSVSARAEGPIAIIGSAADSEVRLLDPSVSHYHCAVVNSAHGSWVVDLLGTGGTAINGEKVRCAPLATDDTITMGRSSVRVAAIEWGDSPLVETSAPTPWSGHEDAAPAPAARHDDGAFEPVPAPQYEPALPDESEPEIELASDPATETRRTGFFAPWRRTPVFVPNRTTAPRSPAESLPDDPAPFASRTDDPVPANSAWEDSTLTDSRWDDPAPTNPARTVQPFEEPVGPEGSERRGSCRYSISGRTALISWWVPVGAPTLGFKERNEGWSGDGAITARGSGSRGLATAVAARDVVEPRYDDTTARDSQQNRSESVTIVDVSHAGLAVLSPVAPPRGERIWFRLDHHLPLDWVEVIAIGSAPARGGHHLVRFAFRETCPYELFKALVFSVGSPQP